MVHMTKTKKVGSAGRFGIRYGRKIRQRLIKVEKELKAKHKCPSCLKPGLKREKAGIWVCKKCGLKIAGKAYKPK
ncbi:MAG: 50S ribosomal protein L37ae [Nanoarchaeota archaeon]